MTEDELKKLKAEILSRIPEAVLNELLSFVFKAKDKVGDKLWEELTEEERSAFNANSLEEYLKNAADDTD
jgi:hypothetical protein